MLLACKLRFEAGSLAACSEVRGLQLRRSRLPPAGCSCALALPRQPSSWRLPLPSVLLGVAVLHAAGSGQSSRHGLPGLCDAVDAIQPPCPPPPPPLQAHDAPARLYQCPCRRGDPRRCPPIPPRCWLILLTTLSTPDLTASVAAAFSTQQQLILAAFLYPHPVWPPLCGGNQQAPRAATVPSSRRRASPLPFPLLSLCFPPYVRELIT